MSELAGRHHWVSTYVGLLDSAFYLDEEELYAVTDIVRKVLAFLNVPDRSVPQVMPLPVVQEVSAHFYSRTLDARDSGLPRNVRAATAQDCTASLEAWREALVGLLITAYPDIDPAQRLVVTKVFTDLLANIGVPARAPAFHPDAVLLAYADVDRVT